MKVTGIFLSADAIVHRTSGNKDYKSRKFCIDIGNDPMYPNTPEFTLNDDKVYLVDKLKEGQRIELNFGLKGRKFKKTDGTGATYTELYVFGIAIIGTQAVTADVPQPTAAAAADTKSDDDPF
jgi:Domain of unknown function (DUF3127)